MEVGATAKAHRPSEETCRQKACGKESDSEDYYPPPGSEQGTDEDQPLQNEKQGHEARPEIFVNASCSSVYNHSRETSNRLDWKDQGSVDSHADRRISQAHLKIPGGRVA